LTQPSPYLNITTIRKLEGSLIDRDQRRRFRKLRWQVRQLLQEAGETKVVSYKSSHSLARRTQELGLKVQQFKLSLCTSTCPGKDHDALCQNIAAELERRLDSLRLAAAEAMVQRSLPEQVSDKQLLTDLACCGGLPLERVREIIQETWLGEDEKPAGSLNLSLAEGL
jgi:hypothetical protein